MKKHGQLLILGAVFVCSFLLLSCGKASRFDCIKSTGKIVKETRNLAYFDKIEIYNKFHVIITQDTVNSVVIEAGENLLSNIETIVVNEQLTIKNNNKCNFVRSYKEPLNIYIGIKNLKEFTHRGAGETVTTNTITSNDLTINSWDGLDTIRMDVKADIVHANMHTGNADIILTGQCNECFIYGRGNGFIRTGQLKSQYVYVNNISSGDYFIWAENKIDALIQYSGNVYYKGNPTIINKEENNIGKLIPL